MSWQYEQSKPLVAALNRIADAILVLAAATAKSSPRKEDTEDHS